MHHGSKCNVCFVVLPNMVPRVTRDAMLGRHVHRSLVRSVCNYFRTFRVWQLILRVRLQQLKSDEECSTDGEDTPSSLTTEFNKELNRSKIACTIVRCSFYPFQTALKNSLAFESQGLDFLLQCQTIITVDDCFFSASTCFFTSPRPRPIIRNIICHKSSGM